MDMREHNAPTSRTPWVIFLFLAIVFFVVNHDWFLSLKGMDAFGTTVDEFSAAVEKGNLLRRTIFFSLGIFGAAVFLSKGRLKLKVNGLLGWAMLTFLSWAMLSWMWSEDPGLTARRLVLLVMLSLGALGVSQRFSPRDLLLWVFFSTLVYLHFGLIAEISVGTFHPLAGGYRFAGTLHPNSQGINCALLFLASLFLLKNEKKWRAALGIIAAEALVFLILTKSRTSMGCAFISLVIYLLVKLPLSGKGAVLLAMTFVISFVLLVASFVLPSFKSVVSLGRADSEEITLTGRIPIWKQLVPYISKRPGQGYGYDSFWTPRHIAEIAKEQSWAVSQGHSAYLDMILSLGVLGGLCYILIMIIGIVRTLFTRRLSSNEAFGFMGIVLVFSVLDGFLESIVIMTNHVTFINMVALAMLGFSSRNYTKEVGISCRESI